MLIVATGALVGWEREPTAHGIVISLEIMTARSAEDSSGVVVAQVALNDRQLRSLARDLRRAADERGLELRPPKRRWWQFHRRR